MQRNVIKINKQIVFIIKFIFTLHGASQVLPVKEDPKMKKPIRDTESN